jgi:hypothetical protein
MTVNIRSTIRKQLLRESKDLEPSGEKVPSRRSFFSRIGKEIITAPVKQALAQQAVSHAIKKVMEPSPLARVINTHSDLDTLKTQMGGHGFKYTGSDEVGHNFHKQDDLGSDHHIKIFHKNSRLHGAQYNVNGSIVKTDIKALKFETPKGHEVKPPIGHNFDYTNHYNQDTHDMILNNGFVDHYSESHDSQGRKIHSYYKHVKTSPTSGFNKIISITPETSEWSYRDNSKSDLEPGSGQTGTNHISLGNLLEGPSYNRSRSGSIGLLKNGRTSGPELKW